MSRPLRICIPGGIYHLIERGNARHALVRDNADRRRFLDVLEQVVERFILARIRSRALTADGRPKTAA